MVKTNTLSRFIEVAKIKILKFKSSLLNYSQHPWRSSKQSSMKIKMLQLTLKWLSSKEATNYGLINTLPKNTLIYWLMTLPIARLWHGSSRGMNFCFQTTQNSIWRHLSSPNNQTRLSLKNNKFPSKLITHSTTSGYWCSMDPQAQVKAQWLEFWRPSVAISPR